MGSRGGRTTGCWSAVPPLLLALAGCGHMPGLHRALLADQDPAGHHGELSSQYVVHCPDVLAIMIDGRPGWCGDRAVGADGRVWLDSDTALRVDGLTVPEITAAAARRCRLQPERIAVRVAEYN